MVGNSYPVTANAVPLKPRSLLSIESYKLKVISFNVKKCVTIQQYQAHTLDGTLRQLFETWYLGMRTIDDELPENKVAA